MSFILFLDQNKLKLKPSFLVWFKLANRLIKSVIIIFFVSKLFKDLTIYILQK